MSIQTTTIAKPKTLNEDLSHNKAIIYISNDVLAIPHSKALFGRIILLNGYNHDYIRLEGTAQHIVDFINACYDARLNNYEIKLNYKNGTIKFR